MSIQGDEILRETRRDPVNITVYGNPVLDVIVDVRPGARHIPERNAIEKIAVISDSGNLEFKTDSYIGFYLSGEPVVWGPFNPNNGHEVYSVGLKFSIHIHVGRDAKQLVSSRKVAMLPGPTLHIGGGGPNVLFGFYDIFAQLRVELIATIEKTAEIKEGRLDPFILPLTDKIGPYTEIPLYDWPGINLCIEGLGPRNDRIIFTAKMIREAQPKGDLPIPKGRSIMVNTLYSPEVAIDALAYACSKDRFGVLALTKSLCSDTHGSKDIFERILDRHPEINQVSGTDYSSIHNFVVRYVLSHSSCVCVVNEQELEHLSGKSVVRGDSKYATLGGVIEALKEVRKNQKNRERFYVTLGAGGSIVADEEDNIIYCGVIVDRNRQPKGKTAIGDTYATFLLALETIGNYIRKYTIPAYDVIKAAASGADSGVYDGFGYLAVNKVNYFLGDKNRRLISLGGLNTFPSASWKEKPVLEIRDSEWESLRHEDYMNPKDKNIFVTSTLQEVIGRAFLRL